MIQNPFLVSLTLLAIVSGLKILNEKEPYKKVTRFLPLPFWCYFLPTILSTLGILPYDLPLYSAMGRLLLPICLFLLLIGTDMKAILHIKGQAFWTMIIGTIGIWIGGLLTFPLASILFSSLWRDELWKGWGALSATWTGGSANMLAIQEIVNIPSSLFSNLILTDTFVAYFWMALLVYLTKYQKSIDKKIGIATIQLIRYPENSEKTSAAKKDLPPIKRAIHVLILLTLSISFGLLFLTIPKWLPSWGAIFNSYLWTVILATAIPLLLSQTDLRNLENLGASSLGQFLLYLMLASIGARANLSNLGSAPIFVLIGFLWAISHGLVLILFGKIFKIPTALLATASQANIGGTISAPLVASLYSKKLTSIGIILATLGNLYGTYAGLFFSQVCRRFSDLIK